MLSWLPFDLRRPGGLARAIAGAAIGSLVVRVAGLAVTFFVGVQLARSLGPTGLGAYGTVMAVIALLVVPAQLGFPQLITRELSGQLARRNFPTAKGALADFSIAVAVASSIVCLLGYAALWRFGPPAESLLFHAFGWGLAVIPVTALLGLGIGALRGLDRVVTAQTFDVITRPALLGLLLIVAARLMPLDASVAVALQALTAAVSLVACLVLIAKACPKQMLATARSRDSVGWGKASLAMTCTEILRVFDGQYAVLLFGIIASQHEVGIFRVAVSVAALVGLPLSMLNVVLMPYLARLHADGDRDRLQLVLTGSAVSGFLAVSAITAGLWFFGEWAIGRAFGAAFKEAWPTLMLMGIAYMINAFFGPVTALLNMCGEERIVTTVFAVGPIVGVTLTLALYGLIGIPAAAIGMVVAELIKGTWMWHAARRRFALNVTILSVGSLLPAPAGVATGK